VVVVDAVSVVGQGREPKQKRLVGGELQRGLAGRLLRLVLERARLPGEAGPAGVVDDVILVDDADPTAWVYFSLTVTNVSGPVLPCFSTVSATQVVRVAGLPKTSGLPAGAEGRVGGPPPVWGACRPCPEPPRSVDDEQLGTAWSARSMGFLMIGNLVAGARRQCENLSVAELSHQLAFQHEENVPFGTPVICEIARRVLNHPHPHLTESAGSPTRRATVTRMLDGRDLLPISDPKGNIVHLHGSTLTLY